VLIRIASNDDEEVQRALWKYLGKLGDEVVVSHAAKAWEDMSILVRCEALKAFAERLYEAGFDQIAEALHSEDRNRGRGGQVFILGVRFT
jgi:HEAT repeat protein